LRYTLRRRSHWRNAPPRSRSPGPGKAAYGRETPGVPPEIRVPEADWELRPPILGLQPPQISGLLGCYSYAQQSRAAGRCRLLVGCFTEQRGHVKTGEYASIRLSGRLDTLQSAAQPVSQSAVGFFDSGGLFVSMTTISSQRN